MHKKTLFFLFIFILINTIQAQITLNISGYVRDSITQEALIGASVYVENTTKSTPQGVVANESGFFSLPISATDSSILLHFSYIGYTQKTLRLTPKNVQSKLLNIQLSAQIQLKTVVISADKAIEQRNEMSVVQIPMSQVRALPRLLGEADIMRVLQLTPGVQQGREGSSALYVRGGTPDQNLILLDDAPLYNVNHLGGFLSVFDENAINSFKLYKGGFPAHYGSRLSSVLDIRMKDGNAERIKGNLQIGLLTMKAYAEGPLTKDKKTTFFASLRRGNLDLLTNAYYTFIAKDVKSANYYTIYDANAKISHRFSDRDRLSLTAYWGEDAIVLSNKRDGYDFASRSEYTSETSGKLAWGNTLVSARHTHVFSPKLFATAALSYTRYNYLTDNKYDYITAKNTLKTAFSFQSQIEDVALRTNFEYNPSSQWKTLVGAAIIAHHFTPSNTAYLQSDSGESKTLEATTTINAPEFQLYNENEFQLNSYISGNIGLHYSQYSPNANTTFPSLQPRFLLNIHPTPQFAVKLGASRMVQYAHLLTNAGIGLPVDIWVPATERVPPETAWQYNIGVAGSLKKYGLEWSVEGFYKNLDNLIDYANGSTFFFGSADWQDKIDKNGLGRVYGGELFLQKKEGKTTGWLGYTYSVNQRKYASQSNGDWYPFRYDQTHAISLAVVHQFSKRVSLSGTWSFHTGNPYTLPNSVYYSYKFETYPISDPNSNQSAYSNTTAYYNTKNNYKMPAYHRLDIGLTIKTKEYVDKKRRNKLIKQKKQPIHFSSEWNIGVYNAYNAMNPYYIYLEKDKDSNLHLKSYTLFPILPSVGYTLKF
jgi:CarboxypepD_reg-like domain/TonB-dependent Receptor Plug Domain